MRIKSESSKRAGAGGDELLGPGGQRAETDDPGKGCHAQAPRPTEIMSLPPRTLTRAAASRALSKLPIPMEECSRHRDKNDQVTFGKLGRSLERWCLCVPGRGGEGMGTGTGRKWPYSPPWGLSRWVCEPHCTGWSLGIWAITASVRLWAWRTPSLHLDGLRGHPWLAG